MRRWMRAIALAQGLFLSDVAVAAPGEPLSVAKVIEADGSFAFSDGASIFQLFKDGRFLLKPAGISGQTIEGVWQQPDAGHFTVVGKWSWYNGASSGDDFRRLKLYINRLPGEAQRAKLANDKLFPVYFIIEELVPISRAEYQKATPAPAR